MYHSIQDIIDICNEENMEFWEVVQRADMDERAASSAESWTNMANMYQAMKDADKSYNARLRSASGLAGGDGEKLGFTDEQMIHAMYVSAGVGAVIAENASIAGASGGCQAEIGSASAMAAAGLVSLQGGTVENIAHGAALALKNMLGLACDPVCGLVEVPCVKRNVAGAVNAVTAAQMAMAGIVSAIPVDEVIDTMRRIGNAMPESLKETAGGRLATTPTAALIAQRFQKCE